MKALKLIALIFLFLISVALLIYWMLPKGPGELMKFDDPWGQERQVLEIKQHGVVAGTPWASEVAFDVLEEGGNAFDAAIAGLLMLYVTHGEASAFPGIAPLMIYHASTDTIRGYIGVGTAPKLATRDQFSKRGFKTIPRMDIYSQLIPAGPDAIISILKEYGTMSFSQLVQPAIDKATEGFPVHHVMHYNLNLSFPERLGFSYLLPYNSKVYLDQKPWKPIHLKERFRRPDLARAFSFLAQIEKEAISSGKTRIESLGAVRDAFYKGKIADEIDTFHITNDGLIRRSDLANYKGKWERCPVGRYGAYEIFVNASWSQGMTLAMALNILKGVDLKSMKQNSGAYIHTLTQAIELAMADREGYFGDPSFVDIPINDLLGSSYGDKRRKKLSGQAFSKFPKPISIDGYDPYYSDYSSEGPRDVKTVGDDTSQIIVVDSSGNMIAITPSDFPMTPMIPNWDLTLGNRMNQFRLEESHPASLEPGKRPRVTPQAVMIRKNGSFYMAINTPGGDNQIQAMLQVLINHIVFEDDIQRAIERPRFMTLGFPSSFAPHTIKQATLEIEENMNRLAITDLVSKGYKVKMKERWGIAAGVGAIIKTEEKYMIGADPRAETVAMGR